MTLGQFEDAAPSVRRLYDALTTLDGPTPPEMTLEELVQVERSRVAQERSGLQDALVSAKPSAGTDLSRITKGGGEEVVDANGGHVDGPGHEGCTAPTDASHPLARIKARIAPNIRYISSQLQRQQVLVRSRTWFEFAQVMAGIG